MKRVKGFLEQGGVLGWVVLLVRGKGKYSFFFFERKRQNEDWNVGKAKGGDKGVALKCAWVHLDRH